jgi:carboxypeptidase T
MKIIVVIFISWALLFSVIPFISYNAQTEGTRSESSLYHSYDEMTSEILEIEQSNSSIVMVQNLTTTFEGKTVWAVKVSDSPQVNDSAEPAVLFMAGQEANSLISVEIALYFLNYLTTNYGVDDEVTEFINNREIWIIPMVNPDGHDYVDNQTMNWEKNRRDNGGTYGVNLNRNYGHQRGEDEHTSSDPVSQNYHGTRAFSEPETEAVRNLALSKDFVLSLSISSYGEMITYPWGYTNSTTSEHELLSEIAQDMAMLNGYGIMQSYEFENSRGNVDDWLFSETNTLPFSLYVGDEDKPQEGEIKAIGQENLDSLIYLLDIADNPNEAMTSQWTFMVYMGADNNLEEDGIRDFNEMEMQGSDPNVNIVVQFDRAPAYDPTNGDWKDTRRFLVMRDYNTNIINSPLKGQLGEKNMADPQTLLDFVNWSMTNYPAEHYFLDIWGHGKGWQGVTLDGSDWLYMDQIKSVLPKFSDRIDVIGFDNCNMAMMEVYTTFLGHTDYIVGSEKEEDAYGWPYDSIFRDLKEEPSTSPMELSRSIAVKYVDWAENNSYYSASVSVVDMDFLEDMINRTDELAREMDRIMSLYYYDIRYAVVSTEKYARKPYPRDLYHFAELLIENVDNTPIKKAAQHVMDGFTTLISANEYWTSPHELPPVPVDNAHGITVWFYDGGTPTLLNTYKELDYAILSYWDEFLAAYIEAPTKPQVSFDSDYTLGDSDNDGNFDTITLEYETNITGLNVTIEIFNKENSHISTLYQHNTQQGTKYSMDFIGLVPDYYDFYLYLENETGVPQNYSEAVNIWLGNEKPDVILSNMTLHRMDGNQVGGGLNKSPIDEEITQIKLYVLNNGSNDLTNIEIATYDGENIIESQTVDLKIQEEKVIVVNWESKAGIRTIRTKVDPANEIKEINETNNELAETVEVKSVIPIEPLIVRGWIFNRESINIIGASVQIKNLRTNETLNRTTNENGYRAELDPNWYNEGDQIEVRGSYNSVSGNSTAFVYSDDNEIWVNITLKTELYDLLFYFKIGLIIFEVIGFALVINYYIKLRKLKHK